MSNLHGTALVVGDRGVFIRGAPGTGKTTLALALLRAGQAAGRFAALVADDQALVSVRGGRLILSAPPAIEGLVELRGGMPHPVRFEPAAVVDLVLRLVPAARAPRLSEPMTEEIEGCAVDLLVLAERNVHGGLAAIAARLSLPPFA